MRGFASLRDFPRGVWVLLGGVLVLRTGAMVAPFLTLFLTEGRGLDPATAGLVVSAYGAGAVLGSIAGGLLADRFGRRPTMLLALTGAGCLFPMGPLVDGQAALMALLFATGFMIDIYRPAAMAAMADMVPEERRVGVYALNYWVANIGSALAPVLGGLLAAFGFGLLFVANGAAILSYALAVLLLFREPAGSVRAEAGTMERVSAWSALRDPVVWTVSGGSVLTSILFVQSYAMLPLAMRADGLGTVAYGMAVGLNAVTVVLFSLPLGQWVGRFEPRRVLAVGALLMGGGMALTGWAEGMLAYCATVVLWSLGEIVIAPVAPALLAAAAPPGRRALYQGTLTASWGWSSLLGPAAGGALYAVDPGLLWAACAGLGVAAAVVFALTPRRKAAVAVAAP